MLHACVQRFDVTENLEKFCNILGTKQAQGSFQGQKPTHAFIAHLHMPVHQHKNLKSNW